MDERERRIRTRLRDDFLHYAPRCLKIRTKEGEVKPLELNRAQLYIHARLEAQKRVTGKVRAILLKGRQQGGSTYVEGRFYWKVSNNRGVQAFILTHETDATKNIFGMAKRYHEHCPLLVRPTPTGDSAKELVFGGLDSSYKVGTAGNKSVGRSGTNQLFHGSEVAFWPNASEHAKGILQTVPDLPGTEVIYESTANGVGNFFHQQWKAAEAGISEFIAIFIPWYWQDEYKKSVPDDFQPSQVERDLIDQYELTYEQLVWRRAKIVELAGDSDWAAGLKAFKQEYPMNAAEAFQVTGGDGLITADAVMKARKQKVTGVGPLVVGVDPSRGGDRFTTIKRQGRKAYGMKGWTGADVDSLGKCVSKCKKILDTVCPIAKRKPDMMFIDSGSGADIVDRLIELGYEDRVKAISFGGSPLNPDKYTNKRNEMWGESAAWLNNENMPVEVPDSDEFQADLCASPYDRDSSDRKVLWRKEKIKREYGFSPDWGDALGLTHAEPVTISTSSSHVEEREPDGDGFYF